MEPARLCVARGDAARAGNSVHVLGSVYVHCVDGQEDIINRRIEEALDAGSGCGRMSQSVTASGSRNRRSCPDSVRHLSAPSPRTASSRARTHRRGDQRKPAPQPRLREFPQLTEHPTARTGRADPPALPAGTRQILPTHSPRNPAGDPPGRSSSRSRPGARELSYTRSDLRLSLQVSGGRCWVRTSVG